MKNNISYICYPRKNYFRQNYDNMDKLLSDRDLKLKRVVKLGVF